MDVSAEMVVDGQLTAYRVRDLGDFLAFYAPDVRVRDFVGTVLMDGVEAMRGQYGPLFRDSPNLRVDIPHRIVVGDYVIDEEQISGFILEGFPDTMRVAVAYRVQDGLIEEVVLFT